MVSAVISEGRQSCDVSIKVLQGCISRGKSIGIGQYASRSTSPMEAAAIVSSESAGSAIASANTAPLNVSLYAATVKKILSSDGTDKVFLLPGDDGTITLSDK